MFATFSQSYSSLSPRASPSTRKTPKSFRCCYAPSTIQWKAPQPIARCPAATDIHAMAGKDIQLWPLAAAVTLLASSFGGVAAAEVTTLSSAKSPSAGTTMFFGRTPGKVPNEQARTEATISTQFERWNAALQSGDAERVARLYLPDSVLLPTLSGRTRTDFAGKVDYFTDFIKLHPMGRIDEAHVRLLVDGCAVNSGQYSFDVTRDGVHGRVAARYSFVYKRVGGEWFIADHHSSLLPTE